MRRAQERGFLAAEAALVILVLAMAGAVLYQAQKTARLRTERATIEAKLVKAEESLAIQPAGRDPAALRQQLQALQANPNSQTLPTRREAVGLITTLTDHAARSGLRIIALSTAEATIPGSREGEKLPALKVLLEGEDLLQKLISMFGAVDGLSMVTVQSLELSAGQDEVWHLKLELVVPYRPTP